MSVPNEPIPDLPPIPAPDWQPEPPIQEPEPDDLPDEAPLPNPDENDEPPMHVSLAMASERESVRESGL